VFIDEIILFWGSFYVHNSLFAECVDTSWRLEACGNINSAAYPLFTLLNMLGIEPYRKVMNLSLSCFVCLFINVAFVMGCYFLLG
jgi:hypothetical protein